MKSTCAGAFAALLLAAGALSHAQPAPEPAPPPTRTAAAAAAAAPSPALAAFRRAIRVKYDLKERAFARHDAETIVTRFYAPDVISVGEGEGIFIGRDQIRPLYQDVVRHNRVRIESVYSYVNGDAGWDWADFHVQPDDPHNRPFTFAILFLWTRVQGEWWCKGDYFSYGSFRAGKLTAPPPAPKPPP